MAVVVVSEEVEMSGGTATRGVEGNELFKIQGLSFLEMELSPPNFLWDVSLLHPDEWTETHNTQSAPLTTQSIYK